MSTNKLAAKPTQETSGESENALKLAADAIANKAREHNAIVQAEV